jgi:hypothetical protein
MAQTEDVSDDMFSDLVGRVIGDLFTEELPTTREQLTARVLSARSTGGASERGAASENAYDMVANMIGDALERDWVSSIPLDINLPVDVPAGTAVADAVDVLSRPERGGSASDGPCTSRSTASGLYVDGTGTRNAGEVYGDIAADMLDQMMLEPILQLIEEPVDPALVLLGDALPPLYTDRSHWSATSSDLRDELALRALDEMTGGTGVSDAVDIEVLRNAEEALRKAEEEEAARRKAAEEEAARRKAAAEEARLKALEEEANKPPAPPPSKPKPTEEFKPIEEVQAKSSRPPTAVVEEESDSFELFFSLPFKNDPEFHSAVKAELLNQYCTKGISHGISESMLGQVKFELREGSTIATISGPAPVIFAMRKVPISDISLMGYQAKGSAEELKPVVPAITTSRSTQQAASSDPSYSARSVGLISEVSATLSEAFYDHAGSLVADVLDAAAVTAEDKPRRRPLQQKRPVEKWNRREKRRKERGWQKLQQGRKLKPSSRRPRSALQK